MVRFLPFDKTERRRFAREGGFVRVDVLGERLFRIRHCKTKQWTESGLNRYGVFARNFPEVAFEQTEANGASTLITKQARLTISRKDGAITLAAADGRPLTQQTAPVYEANGGYDLRSALDKAERLYGLGDVSRENTMRRGASTNSGYAMSRPTFRSPWC